MMIPVVENPRKKRRTARRKTRKTYRRRTRRANPFMASLGNPRRSKRRSRYSVKRRRYSSRRNPSFGLKGFDFQAALMVGSGMIGAEVVPMLVRKVYPALPSYGIMGYAVKLGGSLVTAYAVKMVTKSQRNFQLVMAGGIAMVLVDLFRQYIAPSIGLAGYNDPISVNELTSDFNLNGYVDTSMSGYVDSPVGAY